ncbi:MAG: hypothetical protein MK213_02690 [Planctomycetes bacterium]|nr:hypothetical protein [Planctomycetota bacterium]
MNDPLPVIPAHRLADPAYRDELLEKVEALVSVLESARKKIVQKIEVEEDDVPRLRRVLQNLEGTLSVCSRARSILQHAGPEGELPLPFRQSLALRMTYRDYVEITHFEEFQRLQDLGPISSKELSSIDMESLCQKLIKPSAA